MTILAYITIQIHVHEVKAFRSKRWYKTAIRLYKFVEKFKALRNCIFTLVVPKIIVHFADEYTGEISLFSIFMFLWISVDQSKSQFFKTILESEALDPRLAYWAGAHPGFRSMKWLGVFLLSLDGMLVHRRSLPAIC